MMNEEMIVDQPKIIARFRGKYKFLSNFYESPIEIDGIEYPTVEHAYQERKTLDSDRRRKIRNADTPMESAKLGRADETEIRDGWFKYDLKGYFMRDLVWIKFKQNPKLAKKLVETGDAYLIEGNYWHDNYFGACYCEDCHHSGEQPKNWLGRILMDVREKLKGRDL